MVSVVAPVVPPEGWERLRDRLRARAGAWLAARPAVAAWLVRARAWALWAGLALLLATAAVSATYRTSVKVYLACLWLLVLWFAVTRTKTVRWSSVARMFALCIVWAWSIAWVSARLTSAAGLTVRDPGAGTAVAAFTEEALKLVPLALVAMLAPGRVRRFAAVDWLLLGLASGLGFQAWEDVLRRLAAAVRRPGLWDLLLGGGQGQGSGYPQYGSGLLSGGSGQAGGGDVFGYAGHHAFTGLTAAAVALGIALWRSSGRRSGGDRAGRRVAAVALPVLAWCVTVTSHFGYNAVLADRNWTDGSAPWLLRAAWPVLGKGTGVGWLFLAVLVACLLVDAARLHAAGPVTDLAAGEAGESPWLLRPRVAVERFGGTPLLRAAVALGLHAVRDLTVIAAAHAGGSTRRESIGRGRTAVLMLREVRLAAYEAVLPGGAVAELPGGAAAVPGGAAAESRARRRARAVAAAGLLVLLLAATVWAVAVARQVGTDLTPGGGPFGWLAGQLEALGRWWSERGLVEKLFIGFAIAALVGLSGGSLGLAFGVSGVATYVAEHGQGAATFIRDPATATRSWLTTTTPAEMALDLAEFGLTFAPGNVAGAATGRGLRSTVDDFAADPAAWLARRRSAMTDTGAVHLGGEGRDRLIAGLRDAGVRHNPDDIVRIAQDATGRTVFLETGSARAGLEHILARHADDFAAAGITREQIPDLVMKAVTEGRVVGMQRTRPIYEVEFGGTVRRVAVDVGDNGFVVGANPRG